MLLQRIALQRFRQLDQQEYIFQPGLNVIKGPNEAGKTTLQEAILFALLGDPCHATLQRARTRRVDDRVSWGRNRRFSITLEFTDGDGTLYRLEKDWDAGTVCLTNLSTDTREEDFDSVQDMINKILGYGSLKLLQSTICVEQDAIDDISSGRREIADQLQSIVTGGGLDEATVSNVLAALDDKIAEMERGWRTYAPRNPGPIKVKRDEIESLETQLSEIRPRVERVEEAKERLIVLDQQIQGIKEDLEAKQSLKELCDRRFEWEKRRDTWKAKEQELEEKVQQIEEATEQMKLVEEELKAYLDLGFSSIELEGIERQLLGLHQRTEVLRAEIERWSSKLDQLKAQQPAETLPTRPSLPRAPLIGAGAGGLLFLMGVIIAITGSSDSLIASMLCSGLGLLVGVSCMIWLVISLLNRPYSPDLGSQIAACEAELKQSRREYEEVRMRLAEGLAPFECSTWDEFSELLAQYKRLSIQGKDVQARLDALLGDQTLEALIEERKDASRRRRDAEEALEDPDMRRAAEISPLQYEELKQDIERLNQELAEKEQERVRYRTQCEVESYTIEDVHRLEEQKVVAEQSLAHLEEWLSVYQLTREVINQAKEQTMRVARDELEPRIGLYLSRITQGRYDNVKADDNLNLAVFSQEKGDRITPESGELSRGTVDQLYLAARLALLDLLYPNTKPPLLLDDPFVKFDPERRRQAMALCKEIAAQGYQVLLFTCSDAYDRFADHVIELQGAIA